MIAKPHAVLIEKILNAFESAWRHGARPSIDDYRAGSLSDSRELLVELIHLDMEFRLKGSEDARVETYLERYPQLASEITVIKELAEVELRLRKRQRPELNEAEFWQRFPALRSSMPGPYSDAAPPDVRSSSILLSGTVEEHSEVKQPAAAPRTSRQGWPIVPGFEIVSKLGHGGMGIVYRARDLILDREVAVKLLLDKYRTDSAAATRFLEEAKITGQLQHPGIPSVHQVGALRDGRPFLAMKLIKGQTLDDLLAKGTTSGAPNWLAVFEAICQAVGYAHAHNVVHRDLKPHNVMVGSFGEVQVMDWGLAKVLVGSPPIASAAATLNSGTVIRTERESDTQAGSVLGSPAYMSPEQAGGEIERIDQRSDVFALGAILCVILTGKPPYVGKDVNAVLLAASRGKLNDALARLDASAAEPELIELAKRCLSFEPSDRPADASQVAADVARLRADAEQRARSAELERARAEVQAAEQRKRRRVKLALATILFVLLLGAGIVGWWYDHKNSQERERVARNGQSIESMLKQMEDALRSDDAPKAETLFGQLKDRMAEDGAQPVKARFEHCKTDLEMLRQLNRLDDFRWTWQPKAHRFADRKEFVERSRDAFAAYGIVPESTDVGAAAERINSSLIRDQLLTALDNWLQLDSSPAAILTACDPDPDREEVRRAQMSGGRLRLLAVALQFDSSDQPVRFTVPMALNHKYPDAVRERWLLSTLQRNPSNFGVLMGLGQIYLADRSRNIQEIGDSKDESALICAGWHRAALAVRPANVAAHINLANALQDMNDLDGAIAQLKEAIRLDPDFALAHNNLGNAYHSKRDLGGAIAEFGEAIRIDPDYAVPRISLGRALIDTNDFDGAIAEYKEVIRIDPKNAEAHELLGRALTGKNDLVGAIAECKEAIRLDPTLASAHNALGLALCEKNDLDGGLAEFKEAIRLAPKDACARINLGLCLNRKKDPDGALVEYKEAIRLEPRNPLVHNNLGGALKDKNDLDGAIAAYKESIRLEPKDASVHCNLGIVLKLKKDLEGAIFEFEEAIRLVPKYTLARVNIALILHEKKDYDGAIAVFNEAIRLDPKSALAHTGLGSTLKANNDLDGAEAALKEAIRLDPAFAGAHCELGLALYNKKDLDGADAAFKEAIRLDPKEASAHRGVGLVLFDRGDLDGAIAKYKEAIRLDPKHADWHIILGVALQLKEDLDGAIAAFKEAIRLDPINAIAFSVLGLALHEKEDWDGAIAALMESIRLQMGKKDLDPAPYGILAQCLAKKGQAAAGLQVLRDAAKLNPEWMTDIFMGFRYDSACCAVLAGTGQADDAPPEAHRPALRKEALDWLIADLDAWRMVLSDPEARPEVQETILHWLSDSDLAGVREAENLAELPIEERKAWERLWADVHKLLDETRELLPAPKELK